MDKLYEVLNTLYEIDDNLKNLVCVVGKLEEQEPGMEAATYVAMVRYYLKHVQQELHECVVELDRCYLRIKKESLKKMEERDFE